jgi:hypothetical protein
VSDPVEVLRAGSFVVEVGIRQAWLFLTLCDNSSTPPEEVRIFLDANWTLGPAHFDLDADELEAGLLTLCGLVNGALASPASMAGANLVLDFGERGQLEVDGRGAAATTHDVWWSARTGVQKRD